MLVRISDQYFVNPNFIVSVRKFPNGDGPEYRVVIDTVLSSNSQCSSFIIVTANEAEADNLINSL